MENLDFDTAISKLETILDNLENNSDTLTIEETQKLYEEAEGLKNYCKNLLDKEKSEIIKIAKENDISLDELDFGESEFDDEEEDDEYDDEDEGEDEEDDEDDTKEEESTK